MELCWSPFKIFEVNRPVSFKIACFQLWFNGVRIEIFIKFGTCKFQDNEYAIYRTSQQQMRYMVEFTVGDETPKSVPFPEESDDSDYSDDSDEESDLSDEDEEGR